MYRPHQLDGAPIDYTQPYDDPDLEESDVIFPVPVTRFVSRPLDSPYSGPDVVALHRRFLAGEDVDVSVFYPAPPDPLARLLNWSLGMLACAVVGLLAQNIYLVAFGVCWWYVAVWQYCRYLIDVRGASLPRPLRRVPLLRSLSPEFSS